MQRIVTALPLMGKKKKRKEDLRNCYKARKNDKLND